MECSNFIQNQHLSVCEAGNKWSMVHCEMKAFSQKDSRSVATK